MPDRRPALDYQTALHHGSFGLPPNPPPLLFYRPFLPCHTLLPRRPLPDLHGEPPPPEVHLPGDPCSDTPGPADTQRLCEDDVGKDEGTIGVPTPANNPPSFRSQYGLEAAPYCARGRGVPAGRLCGYPSQTMLPDSVVCESPVQVQHIAVIRVVSIDPRNKRSSLSCVKSGRSANSSGGGTPPPTRTTATCASLGYL